MASFLFIAEGLSILSLIAHISLADNLGFAKGFLRCFLKILTLE